MLDADFARILEDLYASPVPSVFPWITQGLSLSPSSSAGWSIRMNDVIARSDLSIDPKRWSERAVTVRQQIAALPHFRIGDVADVISEVGPPANIQQNYEYVEIQDTNDGVVSPTMRPGWDLPSRARHRADVGDVFVGGIWNSVNKWFVAGGNTTGMVVSNGFHRLKLKSGMSHYLIDLVAGLNTEAYRIQARSAATGSDGLAEISAENLNEVILPEITDASARQTIQSLLNGLLAGRPTIASVVNGLVAQAAIRTATFPKRKSNWVQV